MVMSKIKKKIYSISEEEYREHVDAYDGLCISCGEWTCGGVEPDAHGYECEACGVLSVYGCEEALLMGRLDVTGEENAEEYADG